MKSPYYILIGLALISVLVVSVYYMRGTLLTITTCTDPDGNVLQVGENYQYVDWKGDTIKCVCQDDGEFLCKEWSEWFCYDPDGNYLEPGENYQICNGNGHTLKYTCQDDGTFLEEDLGCTNCGGVICETTCTDPDGNILEVGQNYVICETDWKGENTGYMLKYECKSTGNFEQVDRYWNDVGCPVEEVTCTDPDGNILEVGQNYVICEKNWLGKNTGYMIKYECQSDGNFQEVDKYWNDVGCPPDKVTCTDPDGNVLEVGQNYVICEKKLGKNTGYMLKMECQSDGSFEEVDKYENKIGCPIDCLKEGESCGRIDQPDCCENLICEGASPIIGGGKCVKKDGDGFPELPWNWIFAIGFGLIGLLVPIFSVPKQKRSKGLIVGLLLGAILGLISYYALTYLVDLNELIKSLMEGFK